VHQHKLIQFFITLLCSILTFTTVHADSTITITSGRGEPFTTPKQDGFYDLIVMSMFQRLGLKANTILLPSQRSLINANSGENDGNIARIKGLEKKFPNLLMVPEKIIDFDFVAFYKRSNNISVTNWQSLKPYHVGFIHGWKYFEKKVQHYSSLNKVKNTKQLFYLLKKDRVDLVLYDLWSGLWWLKHHGENIHYLKPPIASVKLYLYVNKKHEKLVPQLAQALADMKRDGTYKAIKLSMKKH